MADFLGEGERKGERKTHAGGTLLKRHFCQATAALIAVFQF